MANKAVTSLGNKRQFVPDEASHPYKKYALDDRASYDSDIEDDDYDAGYDAHENDDVTDQTMTESANPKEGQSENVVTPVYDTLSCRI